MARQKNDELNILSFDTYFGEMELSAAQKKERISLAEKFLDILLYLFSWVDVAVANDENPSEIEAQIDEEIEWELWAAIPGEVRYLVPGGMTYEDALDKGVNLREVPNLRKHIETIALSIAATTAAHIGQEYYTSYERAFDIAGNEVNAVYNNSDFNAAVASDKTTKTWHTIKDERTRPAHWDMDGVTVGINEYFIVGGEPMLYPHWIEASPQNVIGCRCAVTYA